MKIKQISEHIWSLKVWMGIPIHVWTVVSDDGVTLVDGGVSTMQRGIRDFIHRLGAGPLKQILLTHGHSDHVGALPKLLPEMTAQVFGHRIEIPYLEGKVPYPRRKKAAASLRPGLVQPLAEDEGGNLAVVAGLTPFHTPGHSPGHVVYYHSEDRVLLAGDLFTSKNGQLRRPMPMFTGDMDEAIRSAAIVKELVPARLEVCHGTSVFSPGEQVDEYTRRFTRT